MPIPLRAVFSDSFTPTQARVQHILTVEGPRDVAIGQEYQFFVAEFLRHNLDKSWHMSTFCVYNIETIGIEEFLYRFVYFEAISLHLICLKEAKDIDQYFTLQQYISKTSLSERLNLITGNVLGTEDRSKVNKLKEVLEVRNQVAHSLRPVFIKWNNKYYRNNSPKLVAEIKNVIWEGMTALVSTYQKEQEKLNDWIPASKVGKTDTI